MLNLTILNKTLSNLVSKTYYKAKAMCNYLVGFAGLQASHYSRPRIMYAYIKGYVQGLHREKCLKQKSEKLNPTIFFKFQEKASTLM